MKIIGITGQTGLEGKNTLIQELEKEEAIIMDIDKLSRDFYQNSKIIEQTITYLEEKYDIYITELPAFFEALKKARKEAKQLDDPIYKAIENKIDEVIINNSSKDKILVIDWELLPKTKYFDLSNYKVLLLPNTDMARKQTKREILEEEVEKIKEKENDFMDYQKYKYDTIAIDLPDNTQISLLKDFIIKEIKEGDAI